MANISDAIGKMVFFAKTNEDMVKVVQGVFGASTKWWYATFPACGTAPSRDDILEGISTGGHSSLREAMEEADETIPLPLSFIQPFDGDGRWTFDSNIKSLGRWLESSDNPPTELKDIEFAVGYDNVGDVEFGCRHLCLYNALLYHKAGTPLSDIRLLMFSDEHYELTKENLAFVMGYDEGEIEEEWQAHDMDDDD